MMNGIIDLWSKDIYDIGIYTMVLCFDVLMRFNG